jgi:transcriptional regulator GlxA family with amidase domain
MSHLNRRQFGGVAAAALGIASVATANEPAPATSENRFGRMYDGKPPEVGMLLYPGLTLLDLLGPQTTLASSCNVHLLWKTKDWIESDTGIALKPTATFADCPRDLDVIFVGGGPGQVDVMTDRETIEFLADRGSRAKYVTSVCSGSLVLGAAGLLRGYESASHWACLDALRMFGAKPIRKRVVVDRNRYSGGGVTAGIDFGLTLLAALLGDDIAKTSQLAMEYDPQPPFDAGSPQKAGPQITQNVIKWLGPMQGKMLQACQQAAKNMPT